MAKVRRKLHTGTRGGKYYIRKGRRVYISSKRGHWGSEQQRLWVADMPDHSFNT